MLTAEQAAIVKGLLARGEKQHDIAGYFGVNGGRIGEIAKGHKYAEVKAAAPSALPPVQLMVPWGFIMGEARTALSIARIGLASAEARLSEIETRLLETVKPPRKGKHRQ